MTREDDRFVVRAMLDDRQSAHWSECYTLVEGLVHKQAPNIPQEAQKDIVQLVMLRVTRSLRYFRHESTFKTWLSSIISHCIADEVRHRKRDEVHRVPSRTSYYIHEDDEPRDTLDTHHSKTVEDEYTVDEALREAWEAFMEHFATRDHSERDKSIVEMVLYNDYSREEAAKVAGCSVEMVGYVLRTAQAYVRNKLGYRLYQKPSHKL